MVRFGAEKMINFIILDANKKLVGAGAMPNVESVENNISKGNTWLSVLDDDVLRNIDNYYWSNKLNSLERIPSRPSYSGDYVFDVTLESWVDITPIVSLDEYKESAIADLKVKFTKIELGGFDFMGKVIQSDVLSQQRILSSVIDSSIDWITADNSTLTLSSTQFDEMKLKLSGHIQNTRLEYNKAKQAVLDASSKTEIEDIVNE